MRSLIEACEAESTSLIGLSLLKRLKDAPLVSTAKQCDANAARRSEREVDNRPTQLTHGESPAEQRPSYKPRSVLRSDLVDRHAA